MDSKYYEDYLKEAARKIKEFGFRVFVVMHDGFYYGFFSDGKNIGYFEAKPFIGVNLSTHNAKGSDCSGYQVASELAVDELTEQNLRECFSVYPSWVGPLDVVKVVKEKDLDDFLKNYWNAKQLVEL